MYVRLRGERGRRRSAQDLRAAAVLRGAPARPRLRRGARHHGADLRHLPGRLPDERLPGDGGRARRRGERPGRGAAAADLLRRVDGEPRAARLHAARPGLPRLRERHRDGHGPRRGRRAGAADQEGRQPADRDGRRPRGASDQRPGRRLLPRTGPGASSRSSGSRCSGRGTDALETVRWVAALPFPDLEPDYEFVVAPRGRRPVPDPARAASSRSRGIDIEPCGVRRRLRGAPRRALKRPPVGDPRARLVPRRADGALQPQPRPPLAAGAGGGGARPASETAARNPFQSIVVRSVEILYALDEALRLIDAYEPPDPPAVDARAARRRRATGDGGAAGHAVPPLRAGRRGQDRRAPGSCRPPRRTSSRSRRTCATSSPRNIDLSDEELTLRCEQAIRNYDPCISCATHFLRLEVERD